MRTTVPNDSSNQEKAQPSLHPPRPPLAFRVGVVGHRPDPEKRSDPDIPALRALCRQLLVRIQDTFKGVTDSYSDLFTLLSPREDGKPSGLRLITALAKGADQWVADDAAKLGYELQAILPFERTEYEQDFAGSALDEHRRLRDLATAVFELDGDRASKDAAYLAAGRVLLNQTDLLIAVWDGKDPHGVGGTGQIVREALQRGIPTLWVNWNAPADWHLKRPAWKLLRQPVDIQGDLRLLTEQVMELLLPQIPERPDAQPTEREAMEAYFADSLRSRTLLGGWWNFFRDLLCLELKPVETRPMAPEAMRSNWQHAWGGEETSKRQHRLLPALVKKIESEAFLPYAWADRLSVYYADHYRSAFLWSYLLGALAVALALLGMATGMGHGWPLVFIVLEVFAIAGIVALTWVGTRRRWHKRWIDYRSVAERLRTLPFEWLLGGVWHQASVPSHLATSGNPAATWMHWYTRAVERAAGLPHVAVEAEYLAACKELLQDELIVDQERYHTKNAARLEKMNHRLHWLGNGLFLATLGAGVFHLVVDLCGASFCGNAGPWDRGLTFCAAVFPALGAALAAIRSQGELQRLVQRSQAMSEELAQLRQVVANVPTRPRELNSQLLRQAAEQAASLMHNEVLDWRVVFRDHPLEWPA